MVSFQVIALAGAVILTQHHVTSSRNSIFQLVQNQPKAHVHVAEHYTQSAHGL